MSGMSSSSGQTPDQTTSIKSIETQLEQYIKEAEKKGSLSKSDEKNIFSLRDQLQSLSRNKDIPENVRMALHEVVATLKPQKGESLDVEDLQSAKTQIDGILGKGEAGLS